MRISEGLNLSCGKAKSASRRMTPIKMKLYRCSHSART
jgi:hypothetical protein